MLLTSLIRKHIYSYISENNFEPSNQIIVPTSYRLHAHVPLLVSPDMQLSFY